MRKKVNAFLASILSMVALLTCACQGQSRKDSSQGGNSMDTESSVSMEDNSSLDTSSEPNESQSYSSIEDEPSYVDKTPYVCETERKYTLPELQSIDKAFSENIFAFGKGVAMVCQSQRLSLTEEGVRIDDINVCGKTGVGTAESLLAFSQNPAEVRFTVDKKLVNTEKLQGNYTEYYSAEEGIVALATLTSKNGSVLKVYDQYNFVEDGFSVLRTVKVDAVEERAGYSTFFDIRLSDCTEAEYFVPSRIYGDSTVLNSQDEYLSSTSRLPTPVTMLVDKNTGKTLSINCPNPNIRTKSNDSLTTAGVSSEYLYGSLGISKDGVLCAYPCIENGLEANARKYAALNVNNDVQVSFHIRTGKNEDFNGAMSQALSYAVKDMQEIDYQADLDKIYSTCIEDMSSLVVCRDTAYVLPFASYVKNGSSIAYVAQSGYIGMQISCGYELLRYGIQTNNEEIYTNGYNMVNMWATTAIPEGSDSGVFYCYNNGKGYGQDAPTLRQLSDGAEGMLDALRLMETNRPNIDVDAWWNLVYGYAEFLVEAQNSDGSWYRAYDYDGNLLVEGNKWNIVITDNTLADMKYNTQIPIRFLTRMYEYTEDDRYLQAAKKAGEYVKSNVIAPQNYYAGTLDTLGVADREAGIYAFYAMSALYAATGDQMWLDCAEKASAYALSFTFTHDYVVYNRAASLAGKPLESGCTAGLSPIVVNETGSRGVDGFSGYLYYECFKMYLWTGNEYYLKIALILQNCQKRTMDINGEYGYYKKSFMCEATGIMTFVFSTAEGGVWLPWITNSNIEPMTNMLETFGSYSIENLLENHTVEELLNMLTSYGSGGYEYSEI